MSREPLTAGPASFQSARSPPCAVVIFGANGDLTKRKLMPRALSPRLGSASAWRLAVRSSASRERPCPMTISAAPCGESPSPNIWRIRHSTKTFGNHLLQGLFYMPGDVVDHATYQRLADCLKEVEQTRQTGGNMLFYPVHPAQPIRADRRRYGRCRHGWRRAPRASPTTTGLASHYYRKALRPRPQERQRAKRKAAEGFRRNPDLSHRSLPSARKTVQNILAFRFGNGIFEPLWNRRYIDHVLIVAAESIGVEGRGAYYQEAGALRDMI